MKTILLLLALHASVITFSQETIHIHTDKHVYMPGDNIWFKAYLLNNNEPSLLSSNLYAALYDSKGKLITQKHFPVFDGTAHGDFTITDSTSAKALQLRIFTKNMILGDSSNVYLKTIKLGRKRPKNTATKPVLSIKPEGGTLVSGLINHLTIHADADGKFIPFTGAIMENGNKFIDSVVSANGLASIQFVPASGARYTLRWNAGSFINESMDFPPALASGAVIHSEVHQKKLHYSIAKNSQLSRFEKLHMLLKNKTDTIFQQSVTLGKHNQFINNLSLDSFPAGIFTFILTDDDRNILQQKNILINNTIDPVITVKEKNLNPKGKNVIEITSADSMLYNMSVSVTDVSFHTPDDYFSIYDELMLDKQQDRLGKAIRNGDHKSISPLLADHKFFTNLKSTPDNFLSIAVIPKDARAGVSNNSQLDLMINDKAGRQFLNIETKDPAGYKKDGLVFYDSAKIYFQVEKNREYSEKLKVVKLNTINIPQQIPALPADETNYIDTTDVVLEEYENAKPQKFNEVKTIKAVVVKSKYVNPVTKRMEEIDTKYTTGMNRGLARGFQLNALDDPNAERAIDIVSYIGYRIPGLQIVGSLGSRYLINTGDRGTPNVMIDEVESEPQMLESISPSRLAYVKFVPGVVITSSFTSSTGVLYVYTKKGDEPGMKTPGMQTAFVKGYDLQKDFEVRDFSEKASLVNPYAEPTLYWSPYIITDRSNKKITITYYNNDIAKKHIITLKGFAEDGSIIEVKKVVE